MSMSNQCTQIAQISTGTVASESQTSTESQCFLKSLRLLKPYHFSHVFDKPDRKYHASHIMAFVRTNDFDYPRIGLAITKKKVPTAVGRNQFKRIARDNFRLMATNLVNKDIVFIAKRPLNELSNADMHEQVIQILAKLKK